VNGTQGPYLLTSDAVEFRAVTAASASEFRRGYVLVHVYDQVSGIDVVDNWDVEVVYGSNAATAGAATLPARTPNSVILKEFAVSNTGVITLVAASGEFTGPRGGILPVLADGVNAPGHDGAAGSYLGQYRDHPVFGPQRWIGTDWIPIGQASIYGKAWRTSGFSTATLTDSVLLTVDFEASRVFGGVIANLAGASNDLQVPLDGIYRVSAHVYATTGSGYAVGGFLQRVRTGVADFAVAVADDHWKPNTSDLSFSFSNDVPLKANDRLYLQQIHRGSSVGKYYGNNEVILWLSVEYLAPLAGAVPL
jgi:hypothetical protein